MGKYYVSVRVRGNGFEASVYREGVALAHMTRATREEALAAARKAARWQYKYTVEYPVQYDYEGLTVVRAPYMREDRY